MLEFCKSDAFGWYAYFDEQFHARVSTISFGFYFGRSGWIDGNKSDLQPSDFFPTRESLIEAIISVADNPPKKAK